MSRILVLAGGTSPERAVSLRSGVAVAAALGKAGHQVSQLDPAQGLDEAGCRGVDVIFPVLHGLGGEDGSLQRQLEAWQVRYVGSDSTASALCYNKQTFKAAMAQHGISLPQGELVDAAGFATSPLRQAPFVLKPVDSGSSVDTFIVTDPASFTAAPPFARYGRMLLEELVSGTEITVGVLGQQALPVIEIIPPAGQVFDYTNKYNGATQELCPPRDVSPEVQQQAAALAERIHQLTGCRDLSRTDCIVTPQQQLYVLETNTIPGMTEQSLLPRMAAAAGLDMPALCDQLVRAALSR